MQTNRKQRQRIDVTKSIKHNTVNRIMNSLHDKMCDHKLCCHSLFNYISYGSLSNDIKMLKMN